MPEYTSPPEIARETLKRLASERLAPTPDNYRAYYFRISGGQPEEAFPTVSLNRLLAIMPKATPAQMRFTRQLEVAIRHKQWPAVNQAVVELSEAMQSQALAWAPLIRQLIDLLERPHADLTVARKKEALNHVLGASGAEANTLHGRLTRLAESWAAARNGNHVEVRETADTSQPEAISAPASKSADSDSGTGTGTDADAEAAANAEADASANTLIAPALGSGLNMLFDRGLGALLTENADIARTAVALGKRLAEDPALDQAPVLATDLNELTLKLEWAGEDQSSIRVALIALLRLIVENISQLVIDDDWLTGQLTVLKEAFAGPLDIRMLDEVERRLRDVIDQQSLLKKELSDAQQRLKLMLAGFVDRLADMSDSAGAYHDTLEDCSTRIERAHDISELSDVIEVMMRETRVVQEDARRSKEELDSLQKEVEVANAEIVKLQHELQHTSELVRHDPLTGALNRKGLDEALTREIARARRRDSPLCIGLLDIDNFKRINDTHGHSTGDAALQHLAEIARNNLRPQDTLGRYGGEEFVIVLPDTPVDNAVIALQRLQRALTNNYFLAEGQKLLITFSAGVARLENDEAPEVTIDRADKAMYRAKRAGKNRVMMA